MDVRYFLAQDDSCHWYIVRDDKRAEWEVWCDQDPYSEDFDSYPPEGVAYSIGGSPHQVTFSLPECWEEPVNL
jgi:hypothetical protein